MKHMTVLDAVNKRMPSMVLELIIYKFRNLSKLRPQVISSNYFAMEFGHNSYPKQTIVTLNGTSSGIYLCKMCLKAQPWYHK